MAKKEFDSFWGALHVEGENIQKVDPPADTTKKGDDSGGTPEGDDLKGPDTPPAATPPTPPQGNPEGTDGDDDEELTFTETDAEKMFAVLDSEGVLEIGDDDEFDSSRQGIADMVATTVRNKVAKEMQNIPTEVSEFYYHVKKGGSYKDFVPQHLETDWNDADMSDPDTQVLAMKQYLALQGLDNEEIATEIDELVESGKISGRSEKASVALAKKQTKDAATQAAADKQKAAKDEEDRQAEIDGINKIIDDSKEIAGFELDDKRRAGFKDYLFKVNKRTGKTQMQENMNDDERRLKIAYLDFVEFSKDDLEAEVKTKLTRKRKKALSRHKDTNMQGGGRKSLDQKTKKNDVKKINFPTIFGGGNIDVED